MEELGSPELTSAWLLSVVGQTKKQMRIRSGTYPVPQGSRIDRKEELGLDSREIYLRKRRTGGVSYEVVNSYGLVGGRG